MRKSSRMLSSPVGIAVGALLLMTASALSAAPRYMDLRHIEPVHGDAHGTTNDLIMGGVAQTLDDESIQAIAAWLGSLTPARSLR